MGRSKKRHRQSGSPKTKSSRHKPTSPTSSTSSLPAQNPEPSHNQQSRTIIDLGDESSGIQDNSDEDTQNSKGPQLTDEQELRKAQRVHANGGSKSYAFFGTPQLAADVLNKNGRKMLAYPCLACGSPIHRPIYESSPTNLTKHVRACNQREQDEKASKQPATHQSLLNP
ncbi:hypothetical protein PSTG_03357 [Puccinia striiformis f. sp. tritici PST-78]|uniref:BED-type domain-containing protein n=1 Tax=Puccinia striiformis f. sp. tritici PST-78 TaxID=1165861 RepID=A0A0L0VW33_9BASI|nr:hypothetical protein PSTG_03357 [Puccinia striiformis f. sp. tritici PST-78]